MGLFNWFKQLDREELVRERERDWDRDMAEVYSGMRVEVTTFDGRMLFVAKLMDIKGCEAELYQYSESPIPEDTEPFRVRIRGYNDHDRKAVYMEGTISPRTEQSAMTGRSSVWRPI